MTLVPKAPDYELRADTHRPALNQPYQSGKELRHVSN